MFFRPSDGSDGGSVRSDQGGGDNNQRRNISVTNGNRYNERENQQSHIRERDNQPDARYDIRSNNRFNNRPNCSFDDRQNNQSNNRFEDRKNDRDYKGSNRSNINQDSRNDSQPNMFEERRSKLMSKKNDEAEGSSNRQFSNNQTERRGDFRPTNNSQSVNAHETKQGNQDLGSSDQVRTFS